MMEEQGNESDLLGSVIKPPSLRVSGSLKSTLSGRLTPRANSPTASFRRTHSVRTPRKDVRWHTRSLQWLRSRRLLTWLILIVIWAYVGFHFQSRWIQSEHGDRADLNVPYELSHATDRMASDALKAVNSTEFANHSKQYDEFDAGNTTYKVSNKDDKVKKDVKVMPSFLIQGSKWIEKGKGLIIPRYDKSHLHKRENQSSNITLLKHSENTTTPLTEGSQNSRHKDSQDTMQEVTHNSNRNDHGSRRVTRENTANHKANSNELSKEDVSMKNTSYGLLIGPFDKVESKVTGWNFGKRYTTCDRKGSFAHTVKGKTFTLVLHELSMTGAPLAMMELGADILSCGGKVFAVALSKKGGLLAELIRRGIKMLKDKTIPSFKVAMKSDLVIVGSAVSASWIEHYLSYNKKGADRLVWWIMENRYEYFNRSKRMLEHSKVLLFLSEIQSQQWKTWCVAEGIKLPPILEIVPLSVNDELAFLAGIQSALNSPPFSVDKMVKAKNTLRSEVRKIMGLDSNDMLVMTLSSINAGKGQMKLLRAVLMLQNGSFGPHSNLSDLLNLSKDSTDTHYTKRMLSTSESSSVGQKWNTYTKNVNNNKEWSSWSQSDLPQKQHLIGTYERKLASLVSENKKQTLKLLIGSVGSKSNKVPYVSGMLRLVSQFPELARIMLWTPATIHVAPLYAAADVYVINAQGVGETFGRVTIEAMAFGLPVLGTDAGGTKEIVDSNTTGLLHPVGQVGTRILSENIRFLLQNETARKDMGQKGKEKVQKLFLKHHMNDKFAIVLNKAMAYS